MSKEKLEKSAQKERREKKNKKFNILAFILCVFVSFSLWVYVMNTQKSDYTKTFTLSLERINAKELEDSIGLSVFGLPEKTMVTVSGKKSDIRKYSERDFRAYVDLSTVTSEGNTTLNVSVETPSALITVVSIEHNGIVSAYADEKITVMLDLMPVCEEEKFVLSIDSEHSQLEATGPKTYVEKIDHFAVYIPYLDNYTVGDMITSTDIRLHSYEHRELSELYITFDYSKVVVKVEGTLDG